MGVPVRMAWVAPFVIDLSVFGATRGLVLTAPLAVRMKVAMLTPTSEMACPAATLPAPKAVTGRAAAVVPSGVPKESVSEAAAADPTAPPAASSAQGGFMTGSVVPGTRELAEQIVAAGAVRKPVETVAAILSAAEGESRKAVIAEYIGVHHSVVTKTLAAAESHRRNYLAVVG